MYFLERTVSRTINRLLPPPFSTTCTATMVTLKKIPYCDWLDKLIFQAGAEKQSPLVRSKLMVFFCKMEIVSDVVSSIIYYNYFTDMGN